MTEGDEMRRFTTRDVLTYEALSQRVGESFGPGPWITKYKDDEGDIITMSSEDELAEAVALALKDEPAVLRVQVFRGDGKKAATTADKPTAPRGTADRTKTNTPNDNGNTETANHHLPSGVPMRVPEALAPLVNDLVTQLPALAQALPDVVRRVIPNVELDLGASVAATQAANAAASVAATAANACASAGNAAANAFGCDGVEGYHPGVTCDRTNMCPIVGTRFNLKGHDYDICQAEFAKLPADERHLYARIEPVCFRRTQRAERPMRPKEFGGGDGWAQEVHPGVTCDSSGMSPIVGPRFHLPGTNFDLCQAEHAKLPADEQARFQRVPPPRRCGRWGRHGGFGGFGEHGKHCGGKHGGKLVARFVSDVSMPDGMQVTPNTRFTKIWRLKNAGEVHWPPGTRLIHVGGDQLSADAAVPIASPNPIAPNEEVDVAVEMTAPAELGRYMGYWRLSGPLGRRFGQRVWVHVQVVDPSAPITPPTEAEIRSMCAAREAAATDEADDDESVSAAGTQTDAKSEVQTETQTVAAAAAAAETQTEGGAAAEGGAGDADEAGDGGSFSDDGVLVESAGSSAVAAARKPSAAKPEDDAPAEAQGKAQGKAPAAGATEASAAERVAAELRAIGFDDEALVQAALMKHGADLQECALALTNLAEWGSTLDDLEEMGFKDRALNQQLLLQHNGSLKLAIKDLVADGGAA